MRPAVISFRNLSYAYDEGGRQHQVLFDLAGELQAGQIVIVKGPSGSGKTTLFNLLGGLRAMQQGELTVLDHRLDNAGRRERLAVRREIGFIFQIHNLIGALTATQNLMMALRLHPEITRPVQTAHEALAAVGMEHAFDLYPHHLSGGERQRVAVARALVARPKIVLADEPTASLDGTKGRAVVTMLRDLANQQDAAVLLITHDTRILDVGDRVLTLQDGRIIEESRS